MAERHRGDRRRGRPHGPEADDGLFEWVDYLGARMFVVGFTSGGAPYGWVTDESRLDEDTEFTDPPF